MSCFYIFVSLVIVVIVALVWCLKKDSQHSKRKENVALKGWNVHKQSTERIVSDMNKWWNSKKKHEHEHDNNTHSNAIHYPESLLAISRKKGCASTRFSVYNDKENKQTRFDFINIADLDGVISIDFDANTAWIQSNCNMSRLTTVLMQYGLLARVTPEFKHITVGGAVHGLGIESSSFKFGLFHQTCVSFEIIILANHHKDQCDGNTNTNININDVGNTRDQQFCVETIDKTNELFFVIPGSFNSIAMLTAVEIQLCAIPCYPSSPLRSYSHSHSYSHKRKSNADFSNSLLMQKPEKTYVEIEYELISGNRDLLQFCATDNLSQLKCDFLEIMRYPSDDIKDAFVVCCGTIVPVSSAMSTTTKTKKKIKKSNIFSMRYWFHRHYYRHVLNKIKRRKKKKNNNNTAFLEPDYILMYEYLFRHDRGAFWCLNIDGMLHSRIQNISDMFLFRFIFGAITTSKKLFEFRNRFPDQRRRSLEFREHIHCVHDYVIDINKTHKFLQIVNWKYTKNKMLWLCPVFAKTHSTPFLFAPFNHCANYSKYTHSKTAVAGVNTNTDESTDSKLVTTTKKANSSDYFMNIGVYLWNEDWQTPWITTFRQNLWFEQTCKLYSGFKWYYSYSYLNEQDFWEIYDHQKYQFWRSKLKANRMFLDIYEKVGKQIGAKYANVNSFAAHEMEDPWTEAEISSESDSIWRTIWEIMKMLHQNYKATD